MPTPKEALIIYLTVLPFLLVIAGGVTRYVEKNRTDPISELGLVMAVILCTLLWPIGIPITIVMCIIILLMELGSKIADKVL